MTNASHPTKWQDIGWNGVRFQVPETWQPTVIYPDYLFFEEDGRPIFEIKWQLVQGKFSLQNGVKQLKKTFPDNTDFVVSDLLPDLQQTLFSNTAAGFQIKHGNAFNEGMMVYCPACKRVILSQWYFDTEENIGLLAKIVSSLQDHSDSDEQLLAVYDIRAQLPSPAKQLSHELLPGKYTFRFEIGTTLLTLFRFKPAAVILASRSLGDFGRELFKQDPVAEDEKSASWNSRLQGLDSLLARLRRKPKSSWIRLWHDPDQNVILGIKAEGNQLNETGWLEMICDSFTSVDTN